MGATLFVEVDKAKSFSGLEVPVDSTVKEGLFKSPLFLKNRKRPVSSPINASRSLSPSISTKVGKEISAADRLKGLITPGAKDCAWALKVIPMASAAPANTFRSIRGFRTPFN